MVLFDVCKPFNTFRKALIVISAILSITMIVVPYFRNLMGISFVDFTGSEWLLMIILLQAIHPLMKAIKYVLGLLHIIPMEKNKSKL